MDKERQEKEEEERKKGIAVPIPLDHRNQSPLLFLRARSRSRTAAAVHLKLWRALPAWAFIRVIRVRHFDSIEGNFESNLMWLDFFLHFQMNLSIRERDQVEKFHHMYIGSVLATGHGPVWLNNWFLVQIKVLESYWFVLTRMNQMTTENLSVSPLGSNRSWMTATIPPWTPVQPAIPL